MSDILSALILGFTYGVGPCTLSCAPLVVPLIMAASKNKKEGVILSIIFGAGRVMSYIALGVVAALVGSTMNLYISNRWLGLFFIILGLAIIYKLQGKGLCRQRIRITGWHMALIAGIIYGAGPCPPLLALLGLAAVSKSALVGGVMGLVFGLGTIISPIILLGLFSGWFAKHKEFKQVIPYVSGGFLILLGIIYIFR